MGKLEKSKKEFENLPKFLVEYENDFRSNKNKLPYAIKFLTDKYEFKFNEVTLRTEFKKKSVHSELKQVDDRNLDDMLLELWCDAKVSIPFDKLRTIINSSYVSPAYDPFKEYIFSLAKWDGKTDYISLYWQQIH